MKSASLVQAFSQVNMPHYQWLNHQKVYNTLNLLSNEIMRGRIDRGKLYNEDIHNAVIYYIENHLENEQIVPQKLCHIH